MAAPPPGDLAGRLGLHLDRSGLLEPGAAVLVAISGGADSTVLLHLLRFGLASRGLRLRAAHLDHGMRAGSAADADWVRGVARAWAVPLATRRLDAPPRSEADARAERYRFLEDVAASDEWIATAHHLDDQAETVLFRILRGTGVRGLRGIRERRRRVIRPLLPFERAELLEYARVARIQWRVDPSNRDLRFARNRIRHRLLPVLERERPGAARALAELSRHAAEAESGWRSLLPQLEEEAVQGRQGDVVTLARDVVRSYHPEVRARLLRHVLRRYGRLPGRAGTRAALKFINSGRSGGVLHLPGGVRVERDFDRIRLAREPAGGGPHGPAASAAADPGLEGPPAADAPVEIPAAVPGRARATIGGRVFEVSWAPRLEEGGPSRAAVPDWASFPLVLRGWTAGDRIRMEYGSKKLKKLLAERRLDRRSRRSTPVLADANGRVLWIVGVARAAGVGEGGGALEIAVRDAEQR